GCTSTKYTSFYLAVAPLHTEGFPPPPPRLDSRPNPASECAQLHLPKRFRWLKSQSIPAQLPGREERPNRLPCNSSNLERQRRWCECRACHTILWSPRSWRPSKWAAGTPTPSRRVELSARKDWTCS